MRFRAESCLGWKRLKSCTHERFICAASPGKLYSSDWSFSAVGWEFLKCRFEANENSFRITKNATFIVLLKSKSLHGREDVFAPRLSQPGIGQKAVMRPARRYDVSYPRDYILSGNDETYLFLWVSERNFKVFACCAKTISRFYTVSGTAAYITRVLFRGFGSQRWVQQVCILFNFRLISQFFCTAMFLANTWNAFHFILWSFYAWFLYASLLPTFVCWRENRKVIANVGLMHNIFALVHIMLLLRYETKYWMNAEKYQLPLSIMFDFFGSPRLIWMHTKSWDDLKVSCSDISSVKPSFTSKRVGNPHAVVNELFCIGKAQ